MSGDTDSVVDEAVLSMARPAFPVDTAALEIAADADLTDRVVDTCMHHRLGAVVLDAMERVGISPPERLSHSVAADRIHRLRSYPVLDRVAESLDSAGLGWAVFKGPVVGSFMSRPEFRRFNDIDILVHGSDLGQAIDLLREVGVDELNRNWDGYVRHRVGEVPLVAGPVNVDLHWHLVGLGAVRKTMSIAPAEMLDRTRRRQVGSCDASIFDAEDQLMHLAVHSALSGAQRLDQMRDVAILIEADPVDWHELARRCRLSGVATLTAHTLDRSRIAVGAAVDPDYLADLGGMSVRLRRRLDLGSARTASHPHSMYVTPGRDGAGRTIRATARMIRERAASKFGRGVGWDISDEGGPLDHAIESGGAARRLEFINGASVWD